MIRAADLFCGAGAISHGVYRATRRLGLDLDLVAVNHWPRAVKTHAANHPWARHFCGRVDQVRPQTLFPEGKIDLITAGVECTHHSKARGGKPIDDQRRASAWHVLHWAEELRCREILIENVEDFLAWGPLDDSLRPIKEKRGVTFEAFIDALRSLGYVVEHRVLRACNYGDPTSRRRLFIRASRTGDIAWPEATHAEDGDGDLLPWRTAREIIDWSDLGHSIFTRKRPLAPRTIERIAEGLRRFAGDLAPMFLSLLYGNAAGVEAPEGVNPIAAWPFLVQYYGTSTAADIDGPVPTVTAVGNKQALAVPILFEVNHGKRRRPRDLDDPMPTVCTKNGFALATPFVLPHDVFPGRNGLSLVDSPDRPLRTVTASGGDSMAVVSPFLVEHFGERPGQAPRCRSLDRPLGTATGSKGAGSLVQPFIVQYNRTGSASTTDQPLRTVTTRDRFGLVSATGEPADVGLARLDIMFRMLSVRELARAQGFPDEFQFTGTKTDAVRQIGNAVPVSTAEALCYSALAA